MIILRDERIAGDSRYLSAEIKDTGNLVFAGQDMGNGVQDIFGNLEYDWYWTVKAANFQKFENAIGSDILKTKKRAKFFRL